MNAPLWKDTPLESFAGRVFDCPTHRLAYYLGQVDQTIHEVFGMEPDAPDAPDEARQVAHLMMRAITGGFAGSEQENITDEVGRIIAGWQARVAQRAH